MNLNTIISLPIKARPIKPIFACWVHSVHMSVRRVSTFEHYQVSNLSQGWFLAGICGTYIYYVLDIEINIALVWNWYSLKSLPDRCWFEAGIWYQSGRFFHTRASVYTCPWRVHTLLYPGRNTYISINIWPWHFGDCK